MLPPDVTAEGEGRVGIFIGLHAGEEHAQHHGGDEAPLEALAIVVEQRVVRPGDGGARGQQDQRVDQRQVPGIEDLDALGRPDAAGGSDARGLDGFAGEQAGIEEGPEPGDEEHHLGGDEHQHAVAQMEADDRRVIALVGFLDDIAPPHEHGVEHADEAEDRSMAGVLPCIQTTAPMAMMKAETEPTNGHGLGSTRW